MIELRDILRPGLTGCMIKEHPPAVDDILLKAWRTQCVAVSRQLRGKRLGEEPLRTGRLFWSFSMELYPEREIVHILLHGTLPYVAIASKFDWMQIEFGDSSTLTSIFTDPFVVLPKKLLEQPFDLEPWMRPLLDKGALDDIQYYKPRRVGDLVFNHYD